MAGLVAVRARSADLAARCPAMWILGGAQTVDASTPPPHSSAVTPTAGSMYSWASSASDTSRKGRREAVNEDRPHRERTVRRGHGPSTEGMKGRLRVPGCALRAKGLA